MGHDEKKGKKKKKKKDHKRKRKLEEEEEEETGALLRQKDEAEEAKLFVWQAKREKLQEQGVSLTREEQQAQHRERLLELQRLQERRAERDKEDAQWEREKRKLDQERDQYDYAEWLEKEKQFHLEQARRRSEIRLKEGRAKPIDVLYMNLRLDLSSYEFQRSYPYHILEHLSEEELREVIEDIDMYKELNEEDAPFWESLRILAEEGLRHASQASSRLRSAAGVHQTVSAEVNEVFAGKSEAELRELHEQITAKVEEGVDPEYWDALQRQCMLETHRARLRAIHELKMSQAEAQGGVAAQQEAAQAAPLVLEPVDVDEDADEEQESSEDERVARLGRAAKELARRSEQVGQEGQVLTEEHMMAIERNKLSGANEEEFQDEVDTQRDYKWAERIKPRKPKYFNRIKSGYEWNKYNQTHYDSDNPPPKVIKGYKFNIFYPDLIDPSKAPSYKLEKIPGNRDWVILRFTAGPPYEDIAFKIVNKEWKHGARNGFRSVFERGVLRLYFGFKRYTYKR